MSISPFDSTIYGGLFADPEILDLFSDAAEIAAMLRMEAALAVAEGEAGVIPNNAARRIAETAGALVIDPASLAAGTASAGAPVPALVVALRDAVGADAAHYVHWGATSQDVIDTGLVLRLRDVLEIFAARLTALSAQLASLARDHRATLMVGRTRSQQATPTTFGLKVAGWRQPLRRHAVRLDELRPRLVVLSLGGAAGTLAALGDKALAIEAAMARELGLGVPTLPWHSQRDSIAELAGWLSLVTGSLGKIGVDLILLAQSEVREISPGSGGGSSTMPQKANPVGAEALVSLARFNAGLVSSLHHALGPAHERDGAAANGRRHRRRAAARRRRARRSSDRQRPHAGQSRCRERAGSRRSRRLRAGRAHVARRSPGAGQGRVPRGHRNWPPSHRRIGGKYRRAG